MDFHDVPGLAENLLVHGHEPLGIGHLVGDAQHLFGGPRALHVGDDELAKTGHGTAVVAEQGSHYGGGLLAAQLNGLAGIGVGRVAHRLVVGSGNLLDFLLRLLQHLNLVL